MTLTRFFTNYVYYPLGGSRKGEFMTALNIMTVFFLSGLWHGAAWTYVVWGLMQGAAVVFQRTGAGRGLPGIVKKLCSFSYFAFSLAVFRSESLSLALEMFRHAFTPAWTGFLTELASAFSIPETYVFVQALTLKAPQLLPGFYLAVFGGFFALCIFLLTRKNAAETVAGHERRGRPKGYGLILGFLFAFSVISLSKAGAFLYFNF